MPAPAVWNVLPPISRRATTSRIFNTTRSLAVSKPWGDSKTYDFVVGRPGRFVSVQVKSTMVAAGGGYACFVRKQNEAYARGSFDFLAAYVIPEDVWYIIPAKEIRGKGYVSLCSEAKTAKYEKYREAWHLLKEASEVGGEELDSHPSKGTKGGAADEESPAFTPGSVHPGNMEQRMEWVANRVRSWLERRNVRPEKRDEEG